METIPLSEAMLPAGQVEPLLRQLPDWGPVTTIVLHGGSVFEFKGLFPAGSVAEGFYNLSSPDGLGFEGHLRLDRLAGVSFQSGNHRGRESHALVFRDPAGEVVFKVFLGRDAQGQIDAAQKAAFLRMRDTRSVNEE